MATGSSASSSGRTARSGSRTSPSIRGATGSLRTTRRCTASWAFPVTVQGRSVGNLYLTDKAGADEFSEDDQALVEIFAVHAGIAIENARLHEQVQRLAIVDERERIGQDLHDGIIQSIYAVGLSLEDVPGADPGRPRRRWSGGSSARSTACT